MKSDNSIFQNLLAGTAPEIGESFFNVFVQHLAQAYDAEFAFLNELVKSDPMTVRTLAFWQKGCLAENFEYQVKNTPCEQVYTSGLTYFPAGLQKQFANDKELVEMDVHSYLGIPLVSHGGETLGHICVLGNKAVGENEHAKEILNAFAARAAAELERIKLEQEIIRQRDSLKVLVDEKTAELKNAKQLAEHASRAKSELISRMSHELRTPLHAIIGFAEITRDSAKNSTSETIIHNMDVVLESSWRLVSLIEDVLNFSKIDSEGFEKNIQLCNLFDILRVSIDNVKPRANKKSVFIEIADNNEPQINLLTDQLHLIQIFTNILENAIKFNRNNGKVFISVKTHNDIVKISITDTGKGINSDDQTRVFEQFERLSADKECIQGTGIGLAITKRLVEHLGGSIGIESDGENGTTFWLEFLLAKSNKIEASV